jgi:hypothetical protein
MAAEGTMAFFLSDGSLSGGWSLAAGLAVLLLSFPLERLLRPASPLKGRPLAAHGAHLGILVLLFAMLLALVQRPLFAAGLELAFFLLVVFVNNAKYQALREPFVFSDFGLFSQVFRFPRLYLPFLGPGGAVGLPLLVGLILYAGLTLEPSLPSRMGAAGFLFAVTAMAGGGLLLLRRAGCAGLEPNFHPAADLRSFGLVASLWLYWRAEVRDPGPANESPFVGMVAPPKHRSAHSLPDIVAVQSESFFDARRLPVAVRPEVLARFDAVRGAALLSGRLRVAAWGANTMRAEFAFLSGLASDRLGVHRFNPYRRFARQPLPNLAQYLRGLGYRAICIHPHEKGFFARDRVFEALGFDDFIDIQDFRDAERAGPYTADAAVAAKILELLATAGQPLFVFAITMENHGPLHLEQVLPDDVFRQFSFPPPPGCEDLTVYLRHLRNADRMIGDLASALGQRERDGVLCFFGDHVPSMPKVYRALGFDDGRTDYFLWRTTPGPSAEAELDASELGLRLLEAAGLLDALSDAPTAAIPADRQASRAAASGA